MCQDKYEYECDHEWNLMAHCATQQSPMESGVHLWVPHGTAPPPAIETLDARYPVPTIVIWHSPSCNACLNSEPVFAALEANTDGFAVQRHIATPEAIQSMVDSDGHQHIIMLPLYDIIWPQLGASDSVYGKNMRVVSVRNNDVQELARYVPSLKLATKP